MRVLIIEDEHQAARLLENLIVGVDPGIQILGRTDSIKSSVEWLKSNPSPDLIFMDIQLGDGLSFEIFEKVDVRSPVIFTTAYDEYALKAFKVNSIDYILKPVDNRDVQAAILKFRTLVRGDASLNIISNIEQVVQMLTKKYKERFVVKVGEHLRTIEVKDIQYLYSADKATFCHTRDDRNHILDFTMDQLEGILDPAVFFRINRKYMVSSSSIQDIISYTNSRLKIVLKGLQDNDIIVARERVQEFKQWLDK